ncbi:MAG TPA: M20/M25/M40 family metallo-hydrolase, partial [Candidatus Methanoperedenaceae archaeon]|nr:M20/M25/M40 family metallo-hydrolase [Candidatus Methanoperedenaceae archaeon]
MSIRASDWQKRVVLLLVIVLATVAALDQFTPPNVVPSSAPPGDFSAERAMEHLKIIAREPRPLGSQANADVRDYLIDTLSSMGLSPEIQTTTDVQRWPGSDIFQVGTVHNVVVRLPGTESTRAILLDAHYDGSAVGPAASDCGSCVVTLLETLRALKAGPPLKNDIIFVFTDGEENGDIGAAAFASEHHFMKDVGLAINFEALGSRGPAQLYVTSQKNGWLMDQFFKAAPYPLASSFFTDLMGFFPGARPGCDLEEYMDRGRAGFAFLYAGDTSAYHTMRDNVEVIDPRSIQHQGSYALSLARHFGNMDLNAMPDKPNAVFFNVFRNVTVYYSGSWIIPLAVFTSSMFMLIIVLGFYRKHLTVSGLISGAFAFLFSVVITMLLVIVVWQAVRT